MTNSKIALMLGAGADLFAQKPVVRPNGVVNAASYDGSGKGEALVVGGARNLWMR
jgi:hypothetical protein